MKYLPLTLVLALFLAAAVAQTTPTAAPSTVVDKSFVVFNVNPSDAKGRASVEPMFLVRGDKLFSPPLIDDRKPATKAAFLRFAKKHMAAGRRLTLLAGGAKFGEAPVRSVAAEQSGISADVQFATPAKTASMLATDDVAALKLHEDLRLKLEDADRVLLRQRAMDWFAAKHMKAQSALLSIRRAQATRIVADGPRTLVATLEYKVGEKTHLFFMILEEKEGRFIDTYFEHHLAIGESDCANYKRKEFLGQLDLDGDGVDELIVQQGFCESWNYVVLKRVDGAWKQMYEGGGGGE